MEIKNDLIRNNESFAISANRYFVNLSFQGHNTEGTRALYDTGATVSCMTTLLFQQAKKSGRVKRAILERDLGISNASGTHMPTKGVYLIQCWLQGRQIVAPFVICERLNSPAIIGMNVISKWGLYINPVTQKVGFVDAMAKTTSLFDPKIGGYLAATKGFEIAPMEARMVKCQLHNDQHETIRFQTDLLADSSGVAFAISTDEAGNCSYYIKNPSPWFRTISRGQRLAEVTGLETVPAGSISEEKIAQNLSSIFEVDAKLRQPTSTAAEARRPARRFTPAKSHEHAQTGEKPFGPEFHQPTSTSAGARRPARRFTPAKSNEQVPPVPEKQSSKPSGLLRQQFHVAIKSVPRIFQARFMALFCKYHDIFSTSQSDLGEAIGTEHDIQLRSGEPQFARQFTIPRAHMDTIKSNVRDWLKLGIVEPANSPFNAPIFCVPKKAGHGLRVVLDYRKLNADSLPDRYSMKSVDDCLAEIGQAKSSIFSTLDLTSSFWQMRLKAGAKPYTAFTIPGWGQFQWNRGAMGLTGCPASFARMMDAMTADLANVIAYIDDLLIHSASWDEHLQHLELVFIKLRKHNLKLNLGKCEFGKDEVNYLGHVITARGVRPGADKSAAIKNCPSPRTPREIKGFLGMANFFRTYIRNFSHIAAPLFALTRKDSPWKSGDLPPEAQEAFEELRSNLASRPVMAFPTSDGEFHLYVDAAGGIEDASEKEGGLGAALFQIQGEEKRLIAYASRRLQKHEKNYSAFLLEKAAALFGIDHFSHLLRGRKFSLFTDHKPLTGLSKIHTKTLNRLQQAFIDFDFEIKYVPGKDNSVADFLSRGAWRAADLLDKSDGLGVAALDMDKQRLIAAQRTDQQCAKFLIEVQSEQATLATKFRLQRFKINEGVLIAVTKPRKGHAPSSLERIVAPASMQPHLIKQGHDAKLAGHTGTFKTRERIGETFWWPYMDDHIAKHVAKCEPCNAADAHTQAPSTGVTPLPQPREPNERVHVDIFGPLKAQNGSLKYVLVTTDAFSKIVRLAILPDKTAQTVAQAIVDSWINIFGVPRRVISDQGREFCNALQKGLWTLLDIEHSTTTPYHPQCNAQAEVFNRTMGHYLRAMIIQAAEKDGERNEPMDWELLIGPLNLAHNTAVNRATRMTPFYSLFGYNPRLPLWPELDVLDKEDFPLVKAPEKELIRAFLQRQRIARKITHDNNTAFKEEYERPAKSEARKDIFKAGDSIWITTPVPTGYNRKLKPKWEKAIVTAEANPGAFRVRRFKGRRRTKTINAGFMRHRDADDDDTPTEDEQVREREEEETGEEEDTPTQEHLEIINRLSGDLERMLAQPQKWSWALLRKLALKNPEYPTGQHSTKCHHMRTK